MPLPHLRFAILAFACLTSGAHAVPTRHAADGGAEQVVQAFLSLWAHDSGVTAAAVRRLYAPQVVYYGKRLSRAQVLDEKRRFARHWPLRDYRQVPGTLRTSCDRQGSVCSLRALITWQRRTQTARTTTGRASLVLKFATVEGNRKIVREAAHIL